MVTRISGKITYQNQTGLNRLLGFTATKMKYFQRYFIPQIFKVENFNQKK